MTPTTSIAFDNSYARLPDVFFARVRPAEAPSPALIQVNRDLARLLGLDVHRIAFQAFVLASVIGGLAGYLIAISQQQVTPYFGLWATIKGLIAMIIGGMGSIPGAIVGGLLLGVTELQADWFLGAEFRELAAYFLLFAFLIFRPGGVFGRTGGDGIGAEAQRA